METETKECEFEEALNCLAEVKVGFPTCWLWLPVWRVTSESWCQARKMDRWLRTLVDLPEERRFESQIPPNGLQHL